MQNVACAGGLMLSDISESLEAMPDSMYSKVEKFYSVTPASQPVYVSAQQRAASVEEILDWLDESWEKGDIKPSGTWYLEAGKGMGDVLIMANEKMAYTLTDRGTYLAFIRGKKIKLPVLFEGDPFLFNPYGIIAVNPAKHTHVNYIKAMALIGWITSPEGQKIIKDFGKGKFGQPLFVPVAVSNP